MTRMSVFNSPLLLGFDHFERMLDRASKASAEGYPPYNIEQIGENGLRITLAVAGFCTDDLNVVLEDNQLVIHGQLEDKGEDGGEDGGEERRSRGEGDRDRSNHRWFGGHGLSTESRG